MSTVSTGRKPVISTSVTIKRNSLTSNVSSHKSHLNPSPLNHKDSHQNNIINNKDNKDKDSIDSEQTLNNLCNSFLTLCAADPPTSSSNLESKLNEIRSSILFNGISSNSSRNNHNSSILCTRGLVWKLMLGLGNLDSEKYIQLLGKAQSNKYSKIRGDSFRTFPKDLEFKSCVGEVEIIRVLNTFVLEFSPNFTYCQGMNTICAPFLYALPELDAYHCFSRLITQKIPLYWLSSHIGVEAGCKLVDDCLKVVDKELYDHLSNSHLQAYVYAFHCVSSLSASVPPFKELIKLWDFLLAFGPHWNILCVVAQIISLRTPLLQSDFPKELLDYRKWPALRAGFIISIAMSLLPQLNNELYKKICFHAVDPAVAAAITGRKVEPSLL